MTEYSKIARGSVVSTGGQTPVVLPFQPNMVRLINRTAAETPTDGFIPYVDWQEGMGQGSAVYSVFENTGPFLETAYTATGGISTFSAGLSLQYGASQQVVSITKASPAVVTVTGHGYVTGDVVFFEGLYQSPTTGMPQIASLPFVITVTGANTFTIPWDTNQTAYTALSGSPTGATVRKILYPFLYVPGVSYVTAVNTTTGVVTTTAPHNLVVGQQVAFRVPDEWGIVELNSGSNEIIPASPLYGYVVAVGSSTTATISIDMSSFTAYTSNISVARVQAGGLTPMQMVAVGDVNTGGWPISAGSELYPSPIVNGVRTINGPAIQGASINNTRQGFLIGATVAGAASDVIYYEAKLADYSS